MKNIEVIEGFRKIWLVSKSDEESPDMSKTCLAAMKYQNFSFIEKQIKKYIKRESADCYSVLSIGCGAAEDLAQIRKIISKGNLYGIDISRDALLRNKEKRKELDINLICASMSNLPFKQDSKFNMLIAGQSIDLEV